MEKHLESSGLAADPQKELVRLQEERQVLQDRVEVRNFGIQYYTHFIQSKKNYYVMFESVQRSDTCLLKVFVNAGSGEEEPGAEAE